MSSFSVDALLAVVVLHREVVGVDVDVALEVVGVDQHGVVV